MCAANVVCPCNVNFVSMFFFSTVRLRLVSLRQNLTRRRPWPRLSYSSSPDSFPLQDRTGPARPPLPRRRSATAVTAQPPWGGGVRDTRTRTSSRGFRLKNRNFQFHYKHNTIPIIILTLLLTTAASSFSSSTKRRENCIKKRFFLKNTRNLFFTGTRKLWVYKPTRYVYTCMQLSRYTHTLLLLILYYRVRVLR